MKLLNYCQELSSLVTSELCYGARYTGVKSKYHKGRFPFEVQEIMLKEKPSMVLEQFNEI